MHYVDSVQVVFTHEGKAENLTELVLGRTSLES